MDLADLPDQPIEQIAVLVGTSHGATSFPAAEGISPRTVWGYLALQLGGATAYEEVRRDDETLQAPEANQLKRVIGERPTLILLDELARYLVTARGTQVGGTTLDEQTTAFLMQGIVGEGDPALAGPQALALEGAAEPVRSVVPAAAEAGP